MWIDQAADLEAERVAKRVADGRVDLARDLRDRDAEGDRQVEVDVDAVAEADRRARAARDRAARGGARAGVAGETGHPVGAERRRSGRCPPRPGG